MGLSKESRGSVEVICGCMFSGKSTELIKRVEAARLAGHKIQIFNSVLDKRYTKKGIATHNAKKLAAVSVAKAEDILPLINKDTNLVAIDEINFFSKEIAEVAATLAATGVRVICAGLDLDYKARPFESTSHLLAIAGKVDKLTARCAVCGGVANRTQRKAKVKALVFVGGADDYEARCPACHSFFENADL
ncbi:MAG: thymidine kinase [Elusimicrobiota bacterium]|jgi:thymidine kinase|nr:thymidine kinase [Elusimicrobiota bacterium]